MASRERRPFGLPRPAIRSSSVASDSPPTRPRISACRPTDHEPFSRARTPLAIDVGSACVDNNLSAQMRHLRYEAVLTQNGTVVDVALVEPRFRVNSIGRGNRFSGVAYSGGATFTLLGFDFDSPPGPLTYPNVAEQLPDGTVLSLSGTVATVGGQAGLTGQMSGGASSRASAPLSRRRRRSREVAISCRRSCSR